MVAAGCLGLLFFFVPETFWDRADEPDDEKAASEASDPAPSAADPGPSAVERAQTRSAYTEHHRATPRTSYVQSLRPCHGRLAHDAWLRVFARPFVLFAYPAVLWASVVYALAVGWLIVLSESVAVVYERRATYGFSPVQVGLVYLSPFVGGVLGTAAAGKASDAVVRAMARRNRGVYEPEFRLVMAAPIAVTTAAGLMGFGWSVAEHDAWIVPTVFFGVISFGASSRAAPRPG